MPSTLLPPIPHKVPVIDKNGMVSQPWSKWFLFIFERAGGTIAPSNDSFDLGTLEADLAAIESDVTSLQGTASDHEIRITALEATPDGGNVFDLYQVNEVDDAGGGVTYVGKAKTDGKWLLEKLTESAGDITKVYANESNNVGTTTFNTAWTNRLTLTYGRIETITGI